jgi:hypothetical protein
MNLVEAGLFYLRRGIPVFPFRRDKERACVKWEHYNTSYPSEEDVRMWFTKRFNHEFIALVTGKISNIMVVDLDSQEAYDKIQDFLPEGLITPIAKTKRGYHIYFEYRHGLVTKPDYMKDVDVRTDGGCIIAPPSANGDGVEYKWLLGLSIDKIAPAPMPSMLFDTLLQCISVSSSLYTSNSNEHANDGGLTTNDNNDYKGLQYFTEGRRDHDVFHVANCLHKGRCENDIAWEVIKLVAKNCDPPFSEKEAEIKFKSASSRQNVRDRNLAAEIRDWVLTTNGVFLTTNAYNELHLTTREERKNVAVILKRMKDDGIIEKAGNRNGEWRLVDQSCSPMDWINASCEYLPLWMPLNLGEICGVQPGNILVFAGAKDSGKTAWLLNMAKENRHDYKIHYFNSEMGPAEFKLRASKFDDVAVAQWRDVNVYERSENFQDVIKPGAGNLNIIDFLEVVDEFWKVAATLQKIHQKLDGALCVVALQKNTGMDLGRGGAFSLEKARLYVSLDYQKAKIISCKNFKENEIIAGNPRGYTCTYKLVNGCKILKQPPGWTSPVDKPKGE